MPTVLDSLKSDEFKFKIQRFAVESAIARGLAMSDKRVHISVVENTLITRVSLLLDIATQEELIAEAPATWWDAFKEQHFPKWLLRRFPANHIWYVAQHKFPELNLPDNVLGREFVTLKIITWDEFEKLEAKNGLST